MHEGMAGEVIADNGLPTTSSGHSPVNGWGLTDCVRADAKIRAKIMARLTSTQYRSDPQIIKRRISAFGHRYFTSENGKKGHASFSHAGLVPKDPAGPNMNVTDEKWGQKWEGEISPSHLDRAVLPIHPVLFPVE